MHGRTYGRTKIEKPHVGRPRLGLAKIVSLQAKISDTPFDQNFC